MLSLFCRSNRATVWSAHKHTRHDSDVVERRPWDRASGSSRSLSSWLSSVSATTGVCVVEGGLFESDCCDQTSNRGANHISYLVPKRPDRISVAASSDLHHCPPAILQSSLTNPASRSVWKSPCDSQTLFASREFVINSSRRRPDCRRTTNRSSMASSPFRPLTGSSSIS